MTRIAPLVLLSFLSAAAQTPPARVVVVGYDGLGGTALGQAKAPAISALRRNAAWTFHARAVLPTVSSPNWASMIMGAVPSQHGVTSNDWQPAKFTIMPACRGIAATFPTIFGVLRARRPSAGIAIFHQWEGFARLVEPAAPTVIENGRDAADTMKRAIAYLEKHQPDLLFVHLDLVDEALHHDSYLSPAYFAAMAEADRLTGLLLDALDRTGMRPRTFILLTADHGGAGARHGGESMQELEIPWILSGPGVRPGELRVPVNTFDTAPTLARILRIEPPACWIGHPVREAFRDGSAVLK